MTRPRRFTSVLSGWLFAAGVVGVAQGQYQDTDSPDSRMFNSNSRIQSNISDQGTGYSSGQTGLYGTYYNRTLTNQNNLNNSYNAYELRAAARNRAQARMSGLASRGLPMNSARLAETAPPKKTRRATSAEDLGLTLSVNDGRLLVAGVRENSPMARAGFKAGDQIEIVNGKAVHSVEEFQQALGVVAVGQEVPIVIVRDEHSETLKWTPQANDLTLPDNEAVGVEIPPGQESNEIDFIAAAQLTRGQRGQPFLGVRVDANETKQVIVQTVMAGSPAEKAGLQPGDRIYSLSGVNLRSPQELGQMIARNAPGSAVYLYVGRALHPAENRADPQAELLAPAEQMPAGTFPAPAEAASPAPPEPAETSKPVR